MDESKFIGRICPKCNDLYQNYEIIKISLGTGVLINMSCGQGHLWTESYGLNYQGYWYEGKQYDTFGEEIKDV
jgi:hypothetical protein